MIRAAVLGATGYTALELIQILITHPEVEITSVTSRNPDAPLISEVHPRLFGKLDLRITEAEHSSIQKNSDVVFSCLPHAASAEFVAGLLDGNTRVVDFSADYRLTDVDVYSQWYKIEHPDPDRVGTVPYGLPELFADQIHDAALVANPGCFPTGAILGIGPLLKEGLVEADDLIFDSKTGVSGAGRTPKLNFHYPECNESISAYGVGQHRHTPEIKQVLSAWSGKDASLIFTPHLVPMDRGILTTAYAKKRSGSDAAKCQAVLNEFYQSKPFVRLVDHLPATKHVSHTNFCDLAVREVDDRIVVISAIDNLIKGASGAAVQNMNVMFGFDETTGLL